MSKVQIIKKIPDQSLILKGFDKTHYIDCYAIQVKSGDSIDKITTEVFRAPKWVDILMSIRNNLVGLFGLKAGNNEDKDVEPQYLIGSKAGYFKVIDRNANEIVMAEDDIHLNFRTSVLIDNSKPETSIYLSTIVHFNSIWGRLYFLPVKPFHKIIIKTLLNRYSNQLKN